MRGPPLAMMRDARLEFRIADARGRDISDGQAAFGGEPLGVRALARARAAEDEGEVPQWSRGHRDIVTAG